MTGRRVALVVNVQARRGEDDFERARIALVRAGVLVAAAHRVTDPRELPARVEDEVRAGATDVVVGGGDGTLSAAAGRLAGRGVALGVLPLGTANDFARTLGVPPGLDGAAAVVAAGVRRTVDLGWAGERAFLNAASVGVSSALTHRLRGSRWKRIAGPLAYGVAGAAAARELPPFRARLAVDGARTELDALQVVIGNGRWHGGGRLVAPGAAPDDETLDVYVLRARSGRRATHLLALARHAVLLLAGRHLEHPDVVHARARRVELETDPPLDVDADGELSGKTPVVVRVAPGALEVLAATPPLPMHDQLR